MGIFEVLFYQPIYNIIVTFYHLLGDNLGLAIIAIGILSRAVLIPVTARQVKMSESSREFSAKSNEIKKKYKNNKQKQQEELMKLQQEFLPAQLGGCLPLIFQFIIFINVYSVVSSLIGEGANGFNSIAYSFVPKLVGEINGSFLGGLIDLKTAPGAVQGFVNVLPYLAIVILVGIAQYASLKILTGIREKKKSLQNEEKTTKKKKKKKADGPEDFSSVMEQSTKQAMLLMPVLLIFISFNLPAGLSIYLITTSSFVILQQSIQFRLQQNRKEAENAANAVIEIKK